MNNSNINFLQNLVEVILSRATEAKEKIGKLDSNSPEFNYQTGRLMGFNEIITVIQQDSSLFNIEPQSIGLDNLDIDNELV